MKALIVTISILMLAFTTNASEPQETTEQHPRKFFEGAEIFEGKKKPQDMPKYAIMSAFMRRIINLPNHEYGLAIREKMFKEIGLEQTSIDRLLHRAELALEKDEHMTKATVVCDYMKAKGKSTTKAGLAQFINAHEWAMRQIFTDAYYELELYLPPTDATRIKRYLNEEFVTNVRYVRGKDLQAKDIDLKRQFKHCKLIEDKQEAQND